MALLSSISGVTGILTSSDSNARIWRVMWFTGYYTYTEVSIEESFEWVALTKACAQGLVAAAAQVDEEGTALSAGDVASWSAGEDQRTIGSYKATLHIIYAPTLTIVFTANP